MPTCDRTGLQKEMDLTARPEVPNFHRTGSVGPGSDENSNVALSATNCSRGAERASGISACVPLAMKPSANGTALYFNAESELAACLRTARAPAPSWSSGRATDPLRCENFPGLVGRASGRPTGKDATATTNSFSMRHAASGRRVTIGVQALSDFGTSAPRCSRRSRRARVAAATRTALTEVLWARANSLTAPTGTRRDSPSRFLPLTPDGSGARKTDLSARAKKFETASEGTSRAACRARAVLRLPVPKREESTSSAGFFLRESSAWESKFKSETPSPIEWWLCQITKLLPPPANSRPPVALAPLKCPTFSPVGPGSEKMLLASPRNPSTISNRQSGASYDIPALPDASTSSRAISPSAVLASGGAATTCCFKSNPLTVSQVIQARSGPCLAGRWRKRGYANSPDGRQRSTRTVRTSSRSSGSDVGSTSRSTTMTGLTRIDATGCQSESFESISSTAPGDTNSRRPTHSKKSRAPSSMATSGVPHSTNGSESA
mmetsp:Transcript_28965/g.72722  ORF Transcript_28965/g.72722 Transcript_28965/m.72722 type:complete len:494 (-) Transcript_28965:153-1634(-)